MVVSTKRYRVLVQVIQDVRGVGPSRSTRGVVEPETTWKTLNGARQGLVREVKDTITRLPGTAQWNITPVIAMAAPHVAAIAQVGQKITLTDYKNGASIAHWIEGVSEDGDAT